MTVDRYFEELETCLMRLSIEDRTEALAYYREYAWDAGFTTGDEIVAAFGTPKELASKVYAENALKFIDKKDTNGNKKESNSWKAVVVGLLAIFSLPMTFPILLVISIMGFVSIVVGLSLLFALGCVIFAFGVSGISTIVYAFSSLLSLQFGMLLKLLGVGCIFGALAVLLGITLYRGVRWCAVCMTRFTSERIIRRNHNER